MILRVPVLLAGLLCAAGALAASPFGSWTGRFQAGAKGKAPGGMGRARFLMTFHLEKTYGMDGYHVPAKGRTFTAGTWSQRGNVVTTKESGPGGKTARYVLGKGGGTLFLAMPGTGGGILFKR